MKPFDYALGLITILVSLGLAQIVLNLHKLLRRGGKVRWDGRPLVASVLVVVEIIRLWFAQWTTRDLAIAVTFPVTLANFCQMLLLVLLAASCLPDDVEDGRDLAIFYDGNRRYFWGSFAAYQLIYFLQWLFVYGGGQANVGGAVTAFDWLRILVPLAIYVTLTALRSRVLDYLGPLLVTAFYLWLYWGQSLAS
jgi:hypothetical protein